MVSEWYLTDYSVYVQFSSRNTVANAQQMKYKHPQVSQKFLIPDILQSNPCNKVIKEAPNDVIFNLVGYFRHEGAPQLPRVNLLLNMYLGYIPTAQHPRWSSG